MRSTKFPDDIFANFLKEVGSSIKVPAFEANLYDIDLDNFMLYCYTDNSNAMTTYTTTLQAANFTIDDSLQTYYATSPDNKYEIAYMYVEASEDRDACLVINCSGVASY